MKTLQAFLVFIALVLAFAFNAYGAGTADAPSQNLAALWPLLGVGIASLAAYGIRKLSAAYTFFHSGFGAGVLTMLGMVISAVIPVLQSHGLSWTMMAWAAAGAFTSFTATLNPSTTADDPPAKSPAARGMDITAKTVLPFLFLPLVAALALPGCKTAGGKALAACELGQLPQAEQTVIADVTSIIVASGSNWQGQLETIGASLAPGQLNCLLVAIAAAWSSSHGELSTERTAAVVRINAYLAAHDGAKACAPKSRAAAEGGEGRTLGGTGGNGKASAGATGGEAKISNGT